jgi:predicted amidohydrolase YtcJ
MRHHAFVSILPVLAGGSVLTLSSACRPRQPADWVLRNAAVYTMANPAADTTPVQAIAIRAGKIVFVGADSGADRFIGDSTSVLDLGGRMVLPGFHDTHVHPSSGGLTMAECNIEGLSSRAAILDSVKSCAVQDPNGTWVRGRGWELPLFPQANPRKEWLDQMVPDRPVYLAAADGHSAWVNSKALGLAEITRSTPNPPNGRIEHDPTTGEPSGTLRESATALVSAHLPPYTLAQRKEGIKRALALANRLGITTVHDARTRPETLEAYAELDREGELTARVVAAMYVDPDLGMDQVDSLVAWRKRFHGTTYFRPNTAKLFADGVIEAHTAALLAPYTGTDDPGTPNFRTGQMDSLVTALDKSGIQIHIHAIGDRAIRMSLDAIQGAEAANGARASRRPIIAHLELIDPADIPRFKALGVIACFQPLWAFADSYITDLTEPVLGPERSRWLYPIGSVEKSGALVSGGSDWTVSSMNPLEAIQVALTRRAPEDTTAGPAWIPEEVVDLPTMLEAYTRNGAWAAGDETTNGTLEVGKDADVVVLDENLYRIPAPRIHQAKVLLTILDGKEVYRDRVLR